MREIFLINVTGQDRPGLTARLTSILGSHSAEILDIGQAVIHDHLSLGMVVAMPGESATASMREQFLEAAHGLGVAAAFELIERDSYEAWVAEQGKDRHIITLLGRRLTAEHVSQVAAALATAHLNIDQILRLSGRSSLDRPLESARTCAEFAVSGPVPDETALRRVLLNISDAIGVDVSFQVDGLYRRSRRLVVFDMDSTLIQAEVIDELAKEAGAGVEVAVITEAAMRGELDFSESLRRRVATLEGLPESVLQAVAERVPLTEGAARLTGTLKRLGYKLAIVSGGFDYFAKRLQDQLGFDYVFANQLEIVDGKLTGKVLGPIVDGARKAEILKEIAAKEKISLQQTIAVGDGANDLPMLAEAGLGVAFHPKPIVAEKAARAISTVGLDGLLYLIGVRDRDLLNS